MGWGCVEGRRTEEEGGGGGGVWKGEDRRRRRIYLYRWSACTDRLQVVARHKLLSTCSVRMKKSFIFRVLLPIDFHRFSLVVCADVFLSSFTRVDVHSLLVSLDRKKKQRRHFKKYSTSTSANCTNAITGVKNISCMPFYLPHTNQHDTHACTHAHA